MSISNAFDSSPRDINRPDTLLKDDSLTEVTSIEIAQSSIDPSNMGKAMESDYDLDKEESSAVGDNDSAALTCQSVLGHIDYDPKEDEKCATYLLELVKVLDFQNCFEKR